MGRLRDKLRRPTADNTANSFINQVIGNKADAAAVGVVTATDTLMAYIKQIVTHALAEADVEAKVDVIDGYHDVAVANAVTNAVMSDIVGNKTDAAAEDAVSEVESLMAYVKQVVTEGIARDAVIGALDTAEAAGVVTNADLMMAYVKQLVTLAIARDTAIGVIDDLHDVPIADAVTNLYARDVIGIKTDAAINVVTTTKTLMAYLKGVLNEITVPAQNNTDNAFINDVIGQKTDAAAADAVTTDDTLVGYIKQLVTAAIAEAAQSLKLDGVTLATAPVANSLAAYIASGGTALGQELPDSQSLIDLLGDFTGPHNGADQDDNLKTSLDLAHTDLDAIIQQVAKTTALKNVASVTTANLFTIAGGAVQLLGIAGHIKTGLEAAANNTKLVHTSTGGAAADLCGVLDVTGSAIRKLLTITGTKANAMTLSADEGVVVGNLAAPLLLTPGVLSLNCAATTTGDIDWYVVYKPLAPGATIVAA